MDALLDSNKTLSPEKQKLYFGAAAAVYVLLFLSCVQTVHDHSWVLLLGLYVELAGLSIVCFNILRSKSLAGLSQSFLLSYTIATTARFYANMIHPAYLPGDQPAEHNTYRILEVFYVLQFWGLLLSSMTWGKDTVDKDLQGRPEIMFFGAALALVACVARPGVLRPFYLDIIWTYGLYVESLAVVPQLLLFRQKNCRSFILHFFAAVAIGKGLQFFFWFWYFGLEMGRSFLLIHVVCYGVNLLLMSKFIHRYFKEMQSVPLPIFSMK